ANRPAVAANPRVAEGVPAPDFPVVDKDKDARFPFPRPEEARPFRPAPPVNITLTRGQFEADVSFAGLQADPARNRMVRAYRFVSPAGRVYWARVQDHPDINVRVDGPDGPVSPQQGRVLGRGNPQAVFEAKKPAAYTVSVESAFFDAKACRLTIREMDGSEPLPLELRLPRGAVALPRLAEVQNLNVYNKQVATAAFSPDDKFFYMAHGDKSLSYWTDPQQGPRGSYQMKDQLLFGMAVDRRGRVYAQQVVN